jgi:hypothetical protein
LQWPSGGGPSNRINGLVTSSPHIILLVLHYTFRCLLHKCLTLLVPP